LRPDCGAKVGKVGKRRSPANWSKTDSVPRCGFCRRPGLVRLQLGVALLAANAGWLFGAVLRMLAGICRYTQLGSALTSRGTPSGP
jgi:hypothetical protein